MGQDMAGQADQDNATKRFATTRRAFTGGAALAALTAPIALLSACQRPMGLVPSSQPSASAPTPKATAQIATALRQIGVTSFGGVALVAQRGKVLLRQGVGPANMELDVLHTPATKFRIASLSKQFTALATLQLQQRGMVEVQNSVCTYLPNCPAAWQPITLHHLLSHESGLPQDPPDAETAAAQTDFWNVGQWLGHIQEQPLDFAPGTQFSYSNLGYAVLAAVIEQLSGQPYDDFVQANIFTPLGMRDTGPDPAGMAAFPLVKQRASGYVRVADSWQNTGYLDLKSTQTGYGSQLSTVDDLYRWNQALDTQQLVSKAQLAQMFTPNLGGYGYGWFVDDTPGRRVQFHGGNEPGFDSYSARYPDQQATVIVLSNTQQALSNGASAANALADQLAGQLPK
jgi:CubicO group peptidase (beta-lactamase class C family)